MKHHHFFRILLALALSSPAIAEDITLANGVVLKNAKITRVDPDGLRIMHDDGISKVSHESLTPELKAKYNFDSEKAESFRKQTEIEQRDAQKRMREEREQLREKELAPLRKAREEAAKTPRLTEAGSIKGYWIRSLPQPRSLDADYRRKMEFSAYMTERIRDGDYDLEADSTALQWNTQECTRVGELEKAKLFSEQLTAVKQQMAARDKLRQEQKLKQQEFALKQQELHLQAMGIATAQDMSTALNRIAFQMLVGNAIEAKENGMTLNYWEVSR